MGKSNPPARQLKYADFDAMMADVDSLLKNGYESTGQWTLGQATSHVADWMSFPMEGFPKPPIFVRAIFGFMKVTGKAKRMTADILENGFKPGAMTAPQTVPEASFGDEDGVAKLRAQVEKLKNFSGQFHDSPLFGSMDKETVVQVSLLHGAHHFGYLKPKSDS